MDDPLLKDLAQNEPALFLKRFPPPVLIDEIQYAPNLFPYIKMVCDQIQKPNLFWLTGSQQFHLMQNVTETLAGRVGIINLLGFSNRETTGHPASPPFLPQADYEKLSSEPIFTSIWRGSFPAMILNKTMDHNFFYILMCKLICSGMYGR